MGKLDRQTYLRALVVAFAMLFACAATAMAQAAVTMAPPISAHYYGTQCDPNDSVFEWNEVPEDQDVPIERAVFDHGGYQLYDTVGETIIVPFRHDDLYVMKFAVSPNGTMFYVNTGACPVLYVPRDGYLENATIDGARWYPFSERFHPATPVYEGCAPSWSVFIGMGWYPGMVCYGGYWCDRPLWDGGIFIAAVGLLFLIDDHHCYGWHEYADYCHVHPDFHRTGWFRQQDYAIASRSGAWRGHFGGSINRMRAQGINRGREFAGAQGYHGAAAFRGTARAAHAFHGGAASHAAHAFHGATASRAGHAFHGATASRTGHAFHGATASRTGHAFHGATASRAGHAFHGATASRAGHAFHGATASRRSSHSFRGAGRTFSAHHMTPGGRSFGGGGAGGGHSFGHAGAFRGGSGGGHGGFSGHAMGGFGGGRGGGGGHAMAGPHGGGGGGPRGGGGGGGNHRQDGH